MRLRVEHHTDTYKGNYGLLADMNMDNVRSKGKWKILMKRVQGFALLAEMHQLRKEPTKSEFQLGTDAAVMKFWTGARKMTCIRHP